MNDVTVLSIDMIVSNPKIRRGRPIIAGTTLMVQDVAILGFWTMRTQTTCSVPQNWGVCSAPRTRIFCVSMQKGTSTPVSCSDSMIGGGI